jgi:Uma2 family endonuclease
MSLPKPAVRYSPEEYLALERESEERHEYLDGIIYEMAGESPEHGTICTNIVGQLYNQLRGKPCRVFSKDTKVRSGPAPRLGRGYKGLYSYPDLVVVCGELKLLDKRGDVILNPSVVIEVLSPTTEAFDRGEKWLRYQTWLPALTDYVLVSQTAPHIDHFGRLPDGPWIYTPALGLESSVRLDSVGATLQLADVYDRIVFPPEEEPEEDEEEPDLLRPAGQPS